MQNTGLRSSFVTIPNRTWKVIIKEVKIRKDEEK